MSNATANLVKLMCARCGEPAVKRYRLDTREPYRQCACNRADKSATCQAVELPTDCYFCATDEARDHAPMADELCASCGEPYFDGCKLEHHHTAYCIADGMQDVRTLWCGCYAHKECQKSGNICREHGSRA
jgi:hypothetical protein